MCLMHCRGEEDRQLFTNFVILRLYIMPFRVQDSWGSLFSHNFMYITAQNCQSQPKPKPKLEAEMAIFSIVTITHPATHPDKFKFGIRKHNSQKQSCSPI